MSFSRLTIFEAKANLDDYVVIDEIYMGRPSRVLYSGQSRTAQSGIPLDNRDLMLFEYNQRLVELISYLKPKDVLLIGGGALTLPTYIISKYPDITFDIVEPEKKLINIAQRFFNYKPNNQMNIFNTDGLSYLKTTHKKYDLIILDAYIVDHIPKDILTKKFAKLTLSSLNDSGVIAANVISDLKPNSTILLIHENYKKYFKYYTVYPAGPVKNFYLPTNFIYLSLNNRLSPPLKYPSINLLNFSRG